MNIQSEFINRVRKLSVYSEELEKWLVSEGFIVAPASSSPDFHGCYEGGLVKHSLCVADSLKRMSEEIGFAWDREDSPEIIGLFHDLCKFDLYVKCDPYEKHNHIFHYKSNSQADKRHEAKSIDLCKRFFALTSQEEQCILWHMGPWTTDAEGCVKGYGADNSKLFEAAAEKTPGVMLTHQADMYASHTMKT